MKMDAINPIFIVAKKEFIDNVRNKWVIIITIIFTALTLLASYAGSIFSSGWQDLAGTINTMMTLVQYLISIIALILGYSAIIGEIEKGSMNSLLSLPTTRNEILLGKFIGLGTILTVAILIGFGLAGVIIGLNVENVNYGEYLFFIAASIFMALIFLSIGLFLSTVFKKRSTAMGGAIFIWVFFAIIWIFIVAAVIVASNTMENLEVGENIELPEAYFTSTFFNPLSCYSSLIQLNIGSTDGAALEQIGVTTPDYVNSTNMFFAMCIWLFSFLILAFWRFKQKDI